MTLKFDIDEFKWFPEHQILIKEVNGFKEIYDQRNGIDIVGKTKTLHFRRNGDFNQHTINTVHKLGYDLGCWCYIHESDVDYLAALVVVDDEP